MRTVASTDFWPSAIQGHTEVFGGPVLKLSPPSSFKKLPRLEKQWEEAGGGATGEWAHPALTSQL